MKHKYVSFVSFIKENDKILPAGSLKHREQLNRFRFRHRPLDYLASLEMRWEQTTSTKVLPP
jgi:hypothetical protein